MPGFYMPAPKLDSTANVDALIGIGFFRYCLSAGRGEVHVRSRAKEILHLLQQSENTFHKYITENLHAILVKQPNPNLAGDIERSMNERHLKQMFKVEQLLGKKK